MNRNGTSRFTAGCGPCEEAVAMVKRVASSSCEVEVLDMHDTAVATKAGVRREQGSGGGNRWHLGRLLCRQRAE
jgi:hypothetical protein